MTKTERHQLAAMRANTQSAVTEIVDNGSDEPVAWGNYTEQQPAAATPPQGLTPASNGFGAPAPAEPKKYVVDIRDRDNLSTTAAGLVWQGTLEAKGEDDANDERQFPAISREAWVPDSLTIKELADKTREEVADIVDTDRGYICQIRLYSLENDTLVPLVVRATTISADPVEKQRVAALNRLHLADGRRALFLIGKQASGGAPTIVVFDGKHLVNSRVIDQYGGDDIESILAAVVDIDAHTVAMPVKSELFERVRANMAKLGLSRDSVGQINAETVAVPRQPVELLRAQLRKEASAGSSRPYINPANLRFVFGRWDEKPLHTLGGTPLQTHERTGSVEPSHYLQGVHTVMAQLEIDVQYPLHKPESAGGSASYMDDDSGEDDGGEVGYGDDESE